MGEKGVGAEGNTCAGLGLVEAYCGPLSGDIGEAYALDNGDRVPIGCAGLGIGMEDKGEVG